MYCYVPSASNLGTHTVTPAIDSLQGTAFSFTYDGTFIACLFVTVNSTGDSKYFQVPPL